jgi:phage protein D
MKNAVPVVSTARQPRSIVRVAGVAIPFATWQCDNNSYFAADTFRVTFPISTLPSGYGADWWFAQAQIEVEILVGFPADADNPQPSELLSLIYGRVDDLTLELTDTTIEVSGRDLTSVFIDTKTSQKFQNLTASAIASKLAVSHGLTAVVTATTTKVGRYYTQDVVRLQDERSEWDLLTWLAREESFICFVQGHTLYFQPAPAQSQDPYVFQWTAGQPSQTNGTTLRIARNLTLAKDIKVLVHSWNSKEKKGFTVPAQASHARNAVSRRSPIPVSGDAQTYSYTFKNLTREQAQAKANQLLKEITAHEMRLEVEGPADNRLSRTDVIQVQGTGTAADQTYYPDSITRTFNVEDGYAWRIEAKNHSPQTQITL